jgi:hypothetical protein
MSSDEKVIGIAAEFHKDSGGRLKLFSLYTRTEAISRHDGKTYYGADGYDVDWSDTYGYIFHNSSSGFHTPTVSGIYFLWGDMKVKETPCTLVDARDKPPWRGKRTKAIRERNRTRRLLKLPKAFDMEGVSNLLEWLQQNAIESDTEYCSVCRERFPTQDNNVLCDHVWWCAKTATWSTPDERCKCKNYDECADRDY